MFLKKFVVCVLAFIGVLITIQVAGTLLNRGTIEVYLGLFLLLVVPACIGWFSCKYIFKKGIEK